MGKAKIFSDSSNDHVYQSETNNENFVLGSQQNAQGLGGGVFNDSSGYGNFQQSGRDQRNADLNGALFLGNLGFALDTAVLDVTTSTLNLLEDASSNPLPRTSIDKIVTLSAGSTSDLITILGAQRTGQRLRLYNIDTNTITIKNTGSAIDNTIFTPGADDVIVTGNEVVDLTYDITTAKWRVVGSLSQVHPGISFPILYPKEDLTPASGGTATIDLSLETGNAKQIQFPAGNISFEITGDPANTVGEDVYVVFRQDSVGGRSLTSVDSRIKDGSLMNVLLDKAPLAHTLFRIATLGGGTVYHPILINLSTSTSTFLSTLAIDIDKDWAARSISNLAGLDLFTASTNEANDITSMGVITFASDGPLSQDRGQFGHSDFFIGLPDGLVTNIPNTDNITWTVDTTEKFRLDAVSDKLISSIDLDMNTFDIFNIDQARFIFDSGVIADTDSVILLNSNNQFQFNTEENNDFVFSLENIPALIIDRIPGASDQVVVTIQSDNSNMNSTANLNITRAFEPSTSLQSIGQIAFNAPDATNAGTLEYAAIVAKIEDATASFIEGSLSFDITEAGSIIPFLTMNDGSNGIIDALKVLDMNSNDILNVDRLQMSGGTTTATSANDVVWYLNATGDLVSNVNATDGWIWTSNNITKMFLTDTLLEKRNETAPAFQLYNTRTAQTGTAGTISILANSTNFPGGVSMGFIIADTVDATTDGSGSLKLGVNLSGNITPLIALNDSDNGLIDFFTDLDMNTNSITNASFIESDTANKPGDGFVRMAATDQVRWKNILNTDDLFIDAQRPTLQVTTQDAFAFTVASEVQMFIGRFDISVEDNDIINTGDVLPFGTGGEVGDATNFYNQMHAQFFVPEPATVITNRFGLAKTGNTLYVNYNDTDPDAGFSVYEQGLESFRFYNPTATTNEIHIGSTLSFTAGETYRIQLGENSNSSAKIEFTEGANDLFIDRQGLATTQSVALSTASITRFKVNVNEAQLFVPLNVDSQDVINVDLVTADGVGTSVIGETVSNNGGFDYYVRDKIFWEADEDTFIQFQTNGIFIESDDAIELKTVNANEDITITAEGTTGDVFVQSSTGITRMSSSTTNFFQAQDNALIANGANLVLQNGTEEIQFNDAVVGASVTTPGAGDINLFNDATTGELSVKKSTGTVISLEGGGSPLTTKGDIFGFDTADARIPVGTNELPLVADSTVALGVGYEILKIAGGGTGQSVYAEGDILFGQSGGNNLGKLTIGGVNTFLNGGTTPSWSTIALTQLSNVNVPSPGTGNVLTFTGSLWTNQAPSGGDPDGTQEFELTLDPVNIGNSPQTLLFNGKQGFDASVGEPIQDGRAYYVPIFIAKSVELVSLGWALSTDHTGSTIPFIMALYSNKTGDGQNYPDILLASVSGTASVTAVDTPVINTASTPNLDAGVYWIAYLNTGNDLVTTLTLPPSAANTIGALRRTFTSSVKPIEATFGYQSVSVSSFVSPAPSNLNPLNLGVTNVAIPCLFAGIENP